MVREKQNELNLLLDSVCSHTISCGGSGSFNVERLTDILVKMYRYEPGGKHCKCGIEYDKSGNHCLKLLRVF